MEHECAKGSSFGLLLWNIYQSDMSAHVKDANLTVCADNHKMFVKGRDHDIVGRRMKTHGQQALSWYISVNTIPCNDLDIANTELIKLQGVHVNLYSYLSHAIENTAN